MKKYNCIILISILILISFEAIFAESNNIATSTTNNLLNNISLNNSFYPFLPQSSMVIKHLKTFKINKNNDNPKVFFSTQGFTSDGTYLYLAALYRYQGKDQNTRIIKVRLKDYEIVADKDMGRIGHSNSLTYNPRTKKIYVAPMYKQWGCIFEFDTDLNNLNKIILRDKNNEPIKNTWFFSVTYINSLNNYLVKTDEKKIVFFDENFKFVKDITLKESLRYPEANTTQAISTDEKYLYSVSCNTKDKKERNYIRLFDLNGNYINTFIFPKDTYGKQLQELQQIIFLDDGKCLGYSPYKGLFVIYELKLKK